MKWKVSHNQFFIKNRGYFVYITAPFGAIISTMTMAYLMHDIYVVQDALHNNSLPLVFIGVIVLLVYIFILIKISRGIRLNTDTLIKIEDDSLELNGAIYQRRSLTKINITRAYAPYNARLYNPYLLLDGKRLPIAVGIKDGIHEQLGRDLQDFLNVPLVFDHWTAHMFDDFLMN